MIMEYRKLCALLRTNEYGDPAHHLTAYITFAPESFAPGTNYTERERTYIISSNNKAFQPGNGGYSVFGCCLDDKSDPCIRLDQYMAEEHGGKNGWIVEDCCLVGWMLLSSNERELRQPKLFYQREAAVEAMLRELCDTSGCEDYEDVKALFDKHEGEIVDSGYGTTSRSAWLNDGATGNWDWDIRTVRIYSPLKIVMDDIHEEAQGMEYQYYEVCIGPGPFLSEDGSDFWMCIHGIRQPTLEEAEQFCAVEVKNNGGNVLAVNHISKQEARNFYDLSNEANWPVFGKEGIA